MDNQDENEETSDDIQTRAFETRNDSPSAAIPVSGLPDLDRDLEQNDAPDAPLLNEDSNTARRSSWRNLVSFSLPTFNSDSLWRQPHPDRTR